jgi:hypothetical protein
MGFTLNETKTNLNEKKVMVFEILILVLQT